MAHRSCMSCSYVLATMLFLTALLSIGHSASFFSSKYRSLADDPVSITAADCNSDLRVSSICYHCGELDPAVFQELHEKCCRDEGEFRRICSEWYTEEPKRG